MERFRGGYCRNDFVLLVLLRSRKPLSNRKNKSLVPFVAQGFFCGLLSIWWGQVCVEMKNRGIDLGEIGWCLG